MASSREAAEAVPLPWSLPKATITVHSTCCEAKVDQSRKAPNSSATSRVTIRPRFVISPPPGPAPAVQEPGDLGHCSEGSVHEGRVERGCNEWNVKRF